MLSVLLANVENHIIETIAYEYCFNNNPSILLQKLGMRETLHGTQRMTTNEASQ